MAIISRLPMGATPELTGTATAADLLAGKTMYTTDAKTKITGTIPSKGAATITPGTINQTIAANQYLTGVQTILGDPDLIAANILSGKSIFGVDGSVIAGKRFATGSIPSQVNLTGDSAVDNMITGLSFTPSIIIIYCSPAKETSGVYCNGAWSKAAGFTRENFIGYTPSGGNAGDSLSLIFSPITNGIGVSNFFLKSVCSYMKPKNGSSWIAIE